MNLFVSTDELKSGMLVVPMEATGCHAANAVSLLKVLTGPGGKGPSRSSTEKEAINITVFTSIKRTSLTILQ